MPAFKSEEGVWPICGWESRSQLNAVLRQYDLGKKFENRVRNHRSALVAKGLEPTSRQVLEEVIRWIGAGEGPGHFRPETGADPVVGRSGGAPGRRERVRLREDIEWVYWALGAPEGQEGLAPSRGAKVLLVEARENTHWFLQSVWIKLLPKVEAEKSDVERALGDDGRPAEGVERLIADALREALDGPGSAERQGGESAVQAGVARKGARVQRDAGGAVDHE